MVCMISDSNGSSNCLSKEYWNNNSNKQKQFETFIYLISNLYIDIKNEKNGNYNERQQSKETVSKKKKLHMDQPVKNNEKIKGSKS